MAPCPSVVPCWNEQRMPCRRHSSRRRPAWRNDSRTRPGDAYDGAQSQISSALPGCRASSSIIRLKTPSQSSNAFVSLKIINGQFPIVTSSLPVVCGSHMSHRCAKASCPAAKRRGRIRRSAPPNGHHPLNTIHMVPTLSIR